MSFEIINGYVCRNCSEVALAQRGLDPAHPPGKVDPLRDARDADKKDKGAATLAPPIDGRGAVVDLLA